MRTGRFYSFTVVAEEELPLPDYFVLLEPGMNYFNAVVEDLDAFTRMLAEGKATVTKVHPIGEIDPGLCRCGEPATHYTLDGGDSKLVCFGYPTCG